mgnify:CR=1 FL=1
MPELLVASIVASTVAALASAFITRALQKQMKKLDVEITRHSYDAPLRKRTKHETFFMKPDEADSAAINAIMKNLEFEKHVFDVLSLYETAIGERKVDLGQYADFLFHSGSKKFAIEAKNDFHELDSDQIANLLNKEPDIYKLVLVSARPQFDSTVDRIEQVQMPKRFQDFVKSGRVAFVQIPDDERLEKALKQALDQELEESS